MSTRAAVAAFVFLAALVLIWFLVVANRSVSIAIDYAAEPPPVVAERSADAMAPTTPPSQKPPETWLKPTPAPQPVKRPEDPSRYLALPDGSYIEPLNGVERPKPFLWPHDLPFATIVGKELDSHGYWWYVHADGSKSTTYKGNNPLTGKEETVTQIANPKQPLPILESDLPGPRSPGR